MTAVLVLRGPASALGETLDSLARQTRSPERLVVVDPGLDGNAVETVRGHRGVAEAIASITFVTVPGAASLAYAVRSALSQADEGATTDGLTHVWVLTCDSAAAPMTLARLLDAVRRSPSVGAAGPKLMDWSRPGSLRSVGLQLTRSGRVIPSPAPGEPDQGQYDRRSDVLAVPATGMLVERGLLDELGGPERVFGDFGADVDFSWRAQQSGRRVVVVPRATLRTGAEPAPDDVVPVDSITRMRRQARRVALARCAWWALPLLAAWVVLSSAVATVALLLAKRPRAAWAEFSDIGAVLTPGRVLGARWRSRGTRQVRRRDLQGLFVPPRTVLRHTTDLIHDEVALEPGEAEAARAEAVESGPVADEAQDLNLLGATWASRAARNPGLLAVVAMTIVASAASRHLGGSFVERLDNGLSGGEVVGVRAGAGTLWHAWLDGWHGAGLGSAGEQGPHLVVLSALSWLAAHLPLLSPPASPAGAVTAVLVTFAMPLATLTAYLGARVVTHSRWPRAIAALAWSTTAVLATAVGSGRLGGIVAAVLLPLVAAGIALAGRRAGTATVTAATVLAACRPGRLRTRPPRPRGGRRAGRRRSSVAGWARVRGLALAVGPVLLLGPWVATLVDAPRPAVHRPGLSVWGSPPGAALADRAPAPRWPGVLPRAAVGAARARRAPRPAACRRTWPRRERPRRRGARRPRGVPSRRLASSSASCPQGLPDAGPAGHRVGRHGPARVRAGPRGRRPAGRRGARRQQRHGRLAGPGALARRSGPDRLGARQRRVAHLAHRGRTSCRPGRTHVPRSPVDQAESGIGNRMLLLAPEGDGLTYQLLGREVTDVTRTLPRHCWRPTRLVGARRPRSARCSSRAPLRVRSPLPPTCPTRPSASSACGPSPPTHGSARSTRRQGSADSASTTG